MAITVVAASLAAVSVVSYEVYHLLFDRRHVPDAGPLALPVFRDVLSGIYTADLVGAAPVFPAEMEARITAARSAMLSPRVGLALDGHRHPRGRSRRWRLPCFRWHTGLQGDQ